MATMRESGNGEGFAYEQVDNGSGSGYRSAPPNGNRSRRAILYARVSTDEQARSGYSLAQQMEALREYASREGYEVLEEVRDPGQSGASLGRGGVGRGVDAAVPERGAAPGRGAASLERSGGERVGGLVAAGGVSVVLAQDQDRFAR